MSRPSIGARALAGVGPCVIKILASPSPTIQPCTTSRTPPGEFIRYFGAPTALSAPAPPTILAPAPCIRPTARCSRR